MGEGDRGMFRRSRTEARIVGASATALCALGWMSTLWPGTAALVALVLGVLVMVAWKARRWVRDRRQRVPAALWTSARVGDHGPVPGRPVERLVAGGGRPAAAPTWSAPSPDGRSAA